MSPPNNITIPEYIGDYIEVLVDHQKNIRNMIIKKLMNVFNDTELNRAINKYVSLCFINEIEYFCLDIPEMNELIFMNTDKYFLKDVLQDLDTILFQNEQYYCILYDKEKH
jgi:hypothetical protein